METVRKLNSRTGWCWQCNEWENYLTCADCGNASGVSHIGITDAGFVVCDRCREGQ